MGGWWMAPIIVICLVAAFVQSIEGTEILGEGKGDSTVPPSWVVYKTKEEIAYDLLMYGIKNIPSMKFRINRYEDLLEAYREALMVVKEPREPLPLPPGEEKGD